LYSFYYLRQRKIRVCKYTLFQSSAARSQPYDRKWCKEDCIVSSQPHEMQPSAEIQWEEQREARVKARTTHCEYQAEPASIAAFAERR
jgi:hypothetical protein